jgi:hypothetical protein
VSALDTLRAAAAAGVRVTVDKGNLELEASSEPAAALIDGVARHKTEIIGLLDTPAACHDTNAVIAERECQTQPIEAWRAGIARLRLTRFMDHPTVQGRTVFLTDCQAFLASIWAEKAVTAGWDARQLFGCHRDRPGICNWWGALHFIQGGEILAITDVGMSLMTIRGTRQSLRRMDHPYDFIVPVWDVRV